MQEYHLDVKVEKYVDDIILHCGNQAQAGYPWEELQQKMAQCGLKLQPKKNQNPYL
ncbi:hypothetical protein [Pasteuria penetrans]|uniref:hypothetical protein n=1 Tax=Pasteuria penetrans TaxID=86005 RepID=UPI000FA999A5